MMMCQQVVLGYVLSGDFGWTLRQQSAVECAGI